MLTPSKGPNVVMWTIQSVRQRRRISWNRASKTVVLVGFSL